MAKTPDPRDPMQLRIDRLLDERDRIAQITHDELTAAYMRLFESNMQVVEKHAQLCETVADTLAAQAGIVGTRGGKDRSDEAARRKAAVARRNAALDKLKDVFAEVCRPWPKR